MRIGIVGAENSHTVVIARAINQDNDAPGFEVTHVWGETDEFAAKAAAEGAIPTIVSEPADMIGHIDAVIVDHRDGKHHLPAARPFVEAGLPLFVDKPFCIDPREGVEFVRLARARSVPVTSFSTIALSKSVNEFAEAIEAVGPLRSLVTAGPLDIDSPWGGVYFYGVHQVELMLKLLPARPISVSTTRHGDDGVAVITFDSGAIGVIQCLKDYWGGGFVATAYGEKGVHHAPMTSDEKPFTAGIRRFCEMFRTRKEPAPPSSYLLPVAVLQAMQRSFETGQAVEVAPIEDI